MIAICIELLAGQYLATSADRTRCDWPPSPQRLFLALLATAHHAGLRQKCEGALRWLQGLNSSPDIHCGEVNDGQLNRGFGVFVPGNYILKPEKRLDQGWLIGRKELDTFSVTPSDPRIVFVWSSEEIPATVEIHLRELLAHFSYLGRSETQVRAYLIRRPTDLPSLPLTHTAAGEFNGLGIHLATLYPGILDEAEEHWQRATRAYDNWSRQQARTSSKTRGQKGRTKRGKDNERIDAGAALEPPPVEVWPFPEQWPVLYRRIRVSEPVPESLPVQTTRIALLRTVRHVRGRTIPAAFGPLLASEVRGKLVGRQRGGLMVVPLPFVGHLHAGGDVKGIAFYRDLENSGVGDQAIVDDQVGTFAQAELPNGAHEFTGEGTDTPTLAAYTWSGPSALWTSVTPIILPRFPDERRFVEDVQTMLRECCSYIGIHEPFEFEIDRNGALCGVPPVRRFRLPERYQDRPAFHFVLRFQRPVRGPLILGAGRYLGIGLCMPLPDRRA